jgi:hypothetical protein
MKTNKTIDQGKELIPRLRNQAHDFYRDSLVAGKERAYALAINWPFTVLRDFVSRPCFPTIYHLANFTCTETYDWDIKTFDEECFCRGFLFGCFELWRETTAPFETADEMPPTKAKDPLGRRK